MILDGYFCPSIFVGGNNKICQQIDELERLLHATAPASSKSAAETIVKY